MDANEQNKLNEQNGELREELLHLRELAPALRIYEKNLLLRLDEFERQLQANTAAMQNLEARFMQELASLRAAQATHTETLNNVHKFLRRGVWMRRLRAGLSWLILLAVVAVALYAYFFFDWHSLIPSFF